MILEEFLKNLKRGKFMIPYCISCNSATWPPSDHCYLCASKTKLRRIEHITGKLVEFTASNDMGSRRVFGVVDIEGVKLIGSIKSLLPYVGMNLNINACGVLSDGTPFYEFKDSEE
jgi:uncharacterized OB-fold protein